MDELKVAWNRLNVDYRNLIVRYNKITRGMYLVLLIGYASIFLLGVVFASLRVFSAGIFFTLLLVTLLTAILLYPWFLLRKKYTNWPWKIASYVNQQYLFYKYYFSKEPFVLVLRSFEEYNYNPTSWERLQVELKDFNNARPYDHYRHEDAVQSLDETLDLPVSILYVGKLTNCITSEPLKRSLFLATKVDWQSIVEILIEKAIFIIIIPDITQGLTTEYNLLKSRDFLDRTYIYLPRRESYSNRLQRKWNRIRGNFEREGIDLPYNRYKSEDLFWKVNGSYFHPVNMQKEFAEKNSNFFQQKNILNELMEKDFIFPNYFNACKKYFGRDDRLKKYKVQSFFDEKIIL